MGNGRLKVKKVRKIRRLVLKNKAVVPEVLPHSIDPNTIPTLTLDSSWGSKVTFRRCVHTKRDGVQCKGRAMKGTDKCYKHGGGLSKRKMKHGLYSKYVPARLADRYTEYVNDPNIKSLREEIGLIRMTLSSFLEKAPKDIKDVDKLGSLLDHARKLVLACSKIEDGEKYHIDVQVFHVMLNQITRVIVEEVHNEKTRNRISVRLDQLSVPAALG